MLTSISRSRVTSAAACAVLCFSLLLGACSKSNTTGGPDQTDSPSTSSSPARYVASVCASAAEWNRRLRQRGTDFSTKQAGVTDLNISRQNLVDYLDALAADTDAFVGDVQGAGVPPVKNGASIEADALAGLRATAQSYRDAATQAGSLPTDDRTAFAVGVTTIAATIKQEVKATRTSLSTVEDDKILGPLVRANADCTPPQGGA
ncbi:MAG: hypothetical protein M3P11_08595 [Actinomycetota bacterium]|nr:hypothetical protein [Actinomycetota bacterium]